MDRDLLLKKLAEVKEEEQRLQMTLLQIQGAIIILNNVLDDNPEEVDSVVGEP